MKYAIVRRNENAALRVCVVPMCACGNLHRTFWALYEERDGRCGRELKRCGSFMEALVELLLNGYRMIDSAESV